jgi:hypothetical protein
MATENDKQGAETDEDVEVPDIDEQKDDEGNDTTDWKAEALKQSGIAKRLKTREDKRKADEAKRKTEAKVEKKVEVRVSQELDRIDRAVLRAEKITHPDEIELVESMKKETGKSVEDVLESRYFQSELKAMRDERATKEATPSGTKRPGQKASTDIDYWLAKNAETGELPADPALRTQVVNAKIAGMKAKTATFTDTPVVG